MRRFGLVSLGLCLLSAFSAEARNERLNPFNIVTFANDVCTASATRFGTCYTKEECSNKGGTSSGSCASGYGVCCLFALSCGGRSAENNTYIDQGSVTAVTSPCTYKICPASAAVCRIRFSFDTFVTAPPVTGTTIVGAATGFQDQVGSCATDKFSITAPGSKGTPVICGTNTGQHMFVDVSNQECHDATFFVGSGVTSARQWNLRVIQYDCGTEDISGPIGCLQYHTGLTGTFSSFNFPTTAAIAADATHLANQNYDICFRRDVGKCSICFTTVTAGIAANAAMQASFGLSLSPNAAIAQSASGAECDSDYLVIPNAVIGAAVANTVTIGAANRLCGRVFHPTTAQALPAANALVSVCTGMIPFRVTFVTDQGEVGTAGASSLTNELAQAPGGIVGFNLNYAQQNC